MPELTHLALVIAGSAFISIYALIKFVLFIRKTFVVAAATGSSMGPLKSVYVYEAKWAITIASNQFWENFAKVPSIALKIIYFPNEKSDFDLFCLFVEWVEFTKVMRAGKVGEQKS